MERLWRLYTAAELSPRVILDTPPITVRGRIVNENGEPVVASIIIKGTTRGTTSNANGEFELNNINSDAVLVITATNIERQEIAFNNRGFKSTDGNTSVINISVKTAASSLNEVVINKGYYTERKTIINW